MDNHALSLGFWANGVKGFCACPDPLKNPKGGCVFRILDVRRFKGLESYCFGA